MIDREKVLKGLECCCQMNGNVCRTECPYSNECIENECVGTAHLCANALELLKEQEPVHAQKREFAHMWFWCCGSCGVAITEGDKFCRSCGKAVKWDDT